MGESGRSKRRRGSRSRSRSRSRSGERREKGKTEEEVKVASKQDPPKRKRRRWDSNTADGDDATGPASAPPAAAGQGLNQARQAPSAAGNPGLSSALEQAQKAAAIQRQVAERIKGLGGIGGMGALPNVEALKAQTQARLAEAALALQQAKANQAWAPLLLDKEGRQVDAQGKVVVLQKEQTATLKVNQRLGPGDAGDQRPSKAATGGAFGGGAKAAKASGHIDPRVEMPRVERERRTLRFVKPGKYIARAQTMRLKQISREMRSHQFETTEGGSVRRQIALEPIPDVEWWDEPLLNSDSYESGLKEGAITNLVHVPVILDPVAESVAPPPMQMMLTAKERKKIKRIKKTEKQKEEQDKIRLGLIQAPEPKMRLSNLMRVLGNEAIMEPSKMEAKVRKQMATRQQEHQAHNDARALTAEEKRDKKRKKLAEDTNVEVHIAVFRAGDLTDGRRRFKVDIHAQQYNLTGATVIYGNCNVVVVEGGPKGIKKFIRLMESRIKWVPDDDLELEQEEEMEEGSDEEGNAGNIKKVYKKCVLVWQGMSHKRTFRNFRFEHCRSEQQARKIFKDKSVPQYWDMCRNFNEDL